jgi:hypothetical protein
MTTTAGTKYMLETEDNILETAEKAVFMVNQDGTLTKLDLD